MMVSADLLRGYTDAVILRRLAESDGYGYQISKEVSGISSGRLELKEATLYTAFRRLESAGYIKVVRTAGLDVIRILTDLTPEECVIEYYSELNGNQR